VIELRCNGTLLSVTVRDPEWKDAQIFSPKPQPTSGYKPRPVNPKQQLLRLDCAVPLSAWKQGVNEVEVRVSSGESNMQIEKVEAHVKYELGAPDHR
jgi:hypothetical protein